MPANNTAIFQNATKECSVMQEQNTWHDHCP